MADSYISVNDGGSCSDTPTLTNHFSLNEACCNLDYQTILAKFIKVPDTNVGETETLSLTHKWLPLADSGSLVDAVSLKTHILTEDVGCFSDSLVITNHFSLIDNEVTFDVLSNLTTRFTIVENPIIEELQIFATFIILENEVQLSDQISLKNIFELFETPSMSDTINLLVSFGFADILQSEDNIQRNMVEIKDALRFLISYDDSLRFLNNKEFDINE